MKNEKWSIQISKNIADKLKKYCKKNGYTMSRFVEILIEQHFDMEKMGPHFTKKEWESIINEMEKEDLQKDAS
jgi:hypothetical protein